ncbi:MAG TPA: type 2 isopentenyl-diphosphate Delta-isomerase [Bacillota bacterium]|nr:type 2 isopentenyl-diphosphate Delta-isomerase [Bacillota bacterium]
MEEVESIARRKIDHITVCSEKNVVAGKNYLDLIQLVGESVSDFNFDEIDLSCSFLGKKLQAPIMIAAMTGGCAKGKELNDIFATVAEEVGIGLAVGSQRAAIENPVFEDSYSVINKYSIPLILGNIGISQIVLSENPKSLLTQLQSMINADAIAIHCNLPQELSQPEGELFSKGFWEKVLTVSSQVPLMIKETGAGITKKTAKKAAGAGFVAADTGSLGGTSFTAVEHYRLSEDSSPNKRNISNKLWTWGLPTPVSILETKPYLPVIATGGIRNGIDIAKSLVLGAEIAGIARELLIPALNGVDPLRRRIAEIIYELKAVMFLTNCKSLKDLKNVRWFAKNRLKEWLVGLNHPWKSES